MATSKNLQDVKRRQFFDAINTLRNAGLGHSINLPQLVVCGDQSSGKSSVLQAISGGVPFQTAQGLCTKFPMELIMKKCTSKAIRITIKASPTRSAEEKTELESARWEASRYSELDALFTKAGNLIRNGQTSTFFADVLKLEIDDPEVDDLTLIDLPGIFHAPKPPTTTDEIQFVRNLVENYITNERSFILPVITAEVDTAQQKILEMIETIDGTHPLSTERRSMGIITKPDVVSILGRSESLKECLDMLSGSADVHWRVHGWHVLRNRGPGEDHLTHTERNALEKVFFEDPKHGWAEVDKNKKGIEALRERLFDIVVKVLMPQIPVVLREVTALRVQLQQNVESYNHPEPDTKTTTMHLTEFAQSFTAGAKVLFDRRQSIATNDPRVLYVKFDKCVKDFVASIDDDGADFHEMKLSQVGQDESWAKAELIAEVETEIGNRVGGSVGDFESHVLTFLFKKYTQDWGGFAKILVTQLDQQIQQCLEALLHTDPHVGEKIKDAVRQHFIRPGMKNVSRILGDHLKQTLEDIDTTPSQVHHFINDTRRECRAMVNQQIVEKALADTYGISATKTVVQIDTSSNVYKMFMEAVTTESRKLERCSAEEIVACLLKLDSRGRKKLKEGFEVDALTKLVRSTLENIFTISNVHQMSEADLQLIAAENILRDEGLEKASSDLKVALDAERALTPLMEALNLSDPSRKRKGEDDGNDSGSKRRRSMVDDDDDDDDDDESDPAYIPE